MVYYSERVQIKFIQGKRCMGQSPGEFHVQSFQMSSLRRGTDDTNFPGSDVWQHAQSTAIQGISTNSWYPEFLLGICPVDLDDHVVTGLSLQSLGRLSW